ncbi:MAG: C25 family cysteine peptidase [Pseudomonadota bacterium]
MGFEGFAEMCFLSLLLFVSLLCPVECLAAYRPGLIPGRAGISSLSLAFAAPDHDVVQGKAPGTKRLQARGFGFLTSPGDPRIPCMIYTLALPPDAIPETVRLRIVSMESRSIPGTYDIEPVPAMAASSIRDKSVVSWGPGKDIRGLRNRRVYESDMPYPSKAVGIVSVTRLRQYKLVRVSYFPFIYHPKSRRVKLAKRIDAEILFERAGEGQIPLQTTAVDRAAYEMIDNSDQAASWYQSSPVTSEGQIQHDYVIMTTNAIRDHSAKMGGFKSALESLGHSVLVVTEDDYGGLTGQGPNRIPEKVRAWLKNNYQALGIVYVLLVGNPDPAAGGMPMKMCYPRSHESSYREAPSDCFYADLTGNWDLDGDLVFGEFPDDNGPGGVDFDAEVWVGRVPVYDQNYSALDGIFQKLMDYYAGCGDLAWRRKALLPMAMSNYQGEPEPEFPRTDGAELGEWMKSNYLNNEGFISYTLYEKEGVNPSIYQCNTPLTRSNLKAEWAGGYGLICWWGHGSETAAFRKYWSADTDHDGLPDPSELTNTSFFQSSDSSVLDDTRPAFVYQCSCLNGKPENSNNLGYALLGRGGIATVSASRVSWYEVGWDCPNPNWGDNASLGYYYLEGLACGYPCGEAFYVSKGNLSSDMSEIWMNLQGFNLYGDPAMCLANACPTDSDSDGDVDGSDLAALIERFSSRCLMEFAGAFGSEI